MTLQLGDPAEPRYVSAFACIGGVEPQPGDLALPGWFEQLGGICADLHQHAQRWQRPTGFRRKRWDFETTIGSRPIWGSWRQALGVTRDAEALLARCVDLIRKRLSEYGTGPDRFGLIHGDPRLANLLVDRERLWLIDFDDCGFSWFAYDFAASVSFFEHEAHVPDLMSAWMEGYRLKNPWNGEDAAILPILVMLRRIKLLGWVASHPEAPTAQAMGVAYTQSALPMAESLLTTGTTPFAP